MCYCLKQKELAKLQRKMKNIEYRTEKGIDVDFIKDGLKKVEFYLV